MASIHLQPRDGPRAAIAACASTRSARRPAASWIRCVVWRERIRGRIDSARLDERMLTDIGLTQADRDFLVNKPFWRE